MAASNHGWFPRIATLIQSPLFNTAVVWSAFLISRALFLYAQLILLPTAGDCDIRIYARYAAAYERASDDSRSVYDYCRPEYPHLALVVMALPRAGMIDIPTEPADNPDGLGLYRGFFRLEMALFDLLEFLATLWLVKRWFRHEPAWRRTQRLLAYVFGTLLLGTLLYTRLDVALGALVLLSLALLVSRLHYAWSFAVLAVAINFKLVPVVLIPLWVVASLPPAVVRGGRRRLVAVCAWRGVMAVALTVALSVPGYLSSGGRCLDFLTYHRERGLEIGSFYSTALLQMKSFGYPAEFGYGHGSINIDAPAAPLLVRLSPVFASALMLAATVLSCRLLLRRKYESLSAISANPAADLACSTALVLAAFIVGNKVFSPQYLLWLIPLIPLLPGRVRWCSAAFAAACLLSTLTVLLWQQHIIGDSDWVETVTSVRGPTALGSALLIARNVAFLGFGLLLGRSHIGFKVEQQSLREGYQSGAPATGISIAGAPGW
jgi:hypothetical protein